VARIRLQRRAFYANVCEQERKDLPLIHLWIGKNIVGMQQTITGFQQVPDGLIRLQGMAMPSVPDSGRRAAPWRRCGLTPQFADP